MDSTRAAEEMGLLGVFESVRFTQTYWYCGVFSPQYQLGAFPLDPSPPLPAKVDSGPGRAQPHGLWDEKPRVAVDAPAGVVVLILPASTPASSPVTVDDQMTMQADFAFLEERRSVDATAARIRQHGRF